MAETIQELYLKYVDSVAALEDDRYFRYLFEIIQAGDNVLQQNRQVLHKVVDEAWLTVIEDTLDALNTITEKPRRFVKTAEEVVPVALAKKITAQSVRHLSMNTQFIASSENGDIQPTRVLNITQEDSFDLYENRFIYHLIQKLVVFIDKRTDVIFWSTGDEVRNTMMLESKISDAYEEIEYKIEMKVKNRQSYAENDTDNMDIFMRIDRVRRRTMALRSSAFCELMAGCAVVRSPIQRTNLLMKDPNYRKCYQLWQFLESYEGVGYTIEEQNAALEFDEEYLIQIYINLITNYAVFKSLSEEVEDRNLEELEKAFHQVLKPKFVKEIHEEIVDDYNIPEVEVRKVIIEEVTQAQLDAEAKLAEETALRAQAEAERDEAEAEMQQAMIRSQQFMQQMMEAQEQVEMAQSMQAAAEAAAQMADSAREEAELARDEALQQAADAREACAKAERAVQNVEAQKQAAEAACAALEVEKAAAEARLHDAETNRRAAETAAKTAAEEKEKALALVSEAEQAQQAAEAACGAAQQQAACAAQQRIEAENARDAALREREAALAAADTAKAEQQAAEAQAAADREEKEQAQRERAAEMQARQAADAEVQAVQKAAAKAREEAAAERQARDELAQQLESALAALREAENARTEAEAARRAAESDAETHRAAREAAELAQQDAEQARDWAERTAADAAKREKNLMESLTKCEKRLEKTKKKLEAAEKARPKLFGGKK